MACTRASEQITCHESETVGPYPAFSATVENVKIARDMSDSEGGSTGVFIETESGDDIRFTSSFLDDSQQGTVADRIHQFIFVQQTEPSLAFTLPISLLNVGLGAGFFLVMVVATIVSAFGIIRRSRNRNRS